MTKVVTRFAPSPTGNLHIGGARTALYAFLWAKKNGGEFILRIEDTDQTRYQPDAEESIFKGLEWLGIKWDPQRVVRQSERTDVYREKARELVAAKQAYYCFCSPERLETMRQIQRKKNRAPKYDKTCLRLSENEVAEKLLADESHVIRLNIPEEGSVIIEDLVRGKIEFQNKELDDQILLKSDNYPTYHLANIIDDHEAGITHVIRGEEWIPSTPKHILLYEAFGWEAPQFAHLSLFIKKGGGKLSKREGATSLLEYKKLGYLPAAVINFIAFLGWNPKSQQEIFSMEDLISQFELSNINTANPIFDTEKLDWYNSQYIRKLDLDQLLNYCRQYFPSDQPAEYLKAILSLEQARLKKFPDISELTDFFFNDDLKYDVSLLPWKQSTPNETRTYLEQVLVELGNIADWSKDNIEQIILAWIKAKEYGNGDVLWPLRYALTAKKASPSPFEVAGVLGKEKTLERIQNALAVL